MQRNLCYLFGLTACLLSLPADSFSLHSVTSPFLLMCVLHLLISCSRENLNKIFSLVVNLIIILICSVDIFCQVYFFTTLTPNLVSTTLATDWIEAKEFVSVFVTWDLLSELRITTSLLLLVFCILVNVFPINKWFNRWHKSIGNITHKKLMRVVSYAIIVFVIIFELQPSYLFLQLLGSAGNAPKEESLIFQKYNKEMQTPLHRLTYSLCAYNGASRTIDSIKKMNLTAMVDSCSHLSPHIVLVIGESYNKHHSSIYGYKNNTTPQQKQRMENGELYVFKDVVSNWNITSNVFLAMFSLWDCSTENDITDYPLFPVLFRRSAYQVNFYSNQYVLRGKSRGLASQSGLFFLNDSEMSNQLFTSRNEKESIYDKGLIDEFRNSILFTNWKNHNTLDIIHLRGQHIDYAKRYPSDFAVFGESHVQDPSLSKEERNIVAQYDNAVLYNDMILESIISMLEDENVVVIFVADHGNEVFDELHIHGRLFTSPTKSIAKNEYEIPMWIWCSNEYKRLNPQIAKNAMNAVNKPFLIDDIPQVLCYLAGIKSNYLRNERNILSPKYTIKQRIIWDSVDYDQLFSQ